MADERGTWLYVVTGRSDRAALGGLPGVAGETLRYVDAAGLTAVVGDVPLDHFGEEALHRNLENLDWLAATARAHDAVVATAAAGGPVVPVRLATVYRDDDGVRAALAERAADFHRTLELVAGRTEWGVKMFAASAPEPVTAQGVPSGRGAGTAYLARRRAALDSRERQDQRAAEQADRAHRALAALAAATRAHRPQDRALAGDDGRMIRNVAYLVDDDRGSAFTDAVAACGRDSDAIRVQLTGPWPPYSFTASEQP